VAFILTGAAGLIWIVPWLWLYRQPRRSKLIRETELQLIEEEKLNEGSSETRWTWIQVLTFKATWLLLLGRLMTDAVWYFYQFWFPKYLSTERHLDQEQLKITWIIYAAAGAGSLVGGWLSGILVKRGAAPATSRLWVMLGCACLLPLSPLITQVSGLSTAMTITVIVVFASLAWLINISSIIVDVVPRHSLVRCSASWRRAARWAAS
jgi:ACS family hexuronate transporter-like MFS transporter